MIDVQSGARASLKSTDSGPWSAVPSLLCCTLLFACQPRPTDPATVALEPPSYASIAAAHNARIGRLHDIESRGVVELTWHDEDGRRHREPQVNVDLWINLPHRASMRLEKLSETYLWLGCDADRYWLFDLTGEERVLYMGQPDQPMVFGAHLPVPFQPRQLLDLIGVTTLPLAGESEPVVAHDPETDAWRVTTGALRYHFARQSLLPRRIDLLNDAGEVALYSDLRNEQYVSTPNVPRLRQPQIPGMIDIHTADGSAHIKLVLTDPRAETFERAFDLARLRAGLKPDRVEMAPE